MANESQKELKKLLREIQDDQLKITENQARYNNQGKLGVEASKELVKLKKREADLEDYIASVKEKQAATSDDIGLSLVQQFKTAKLIAGADKARTNLLKKQQTSLGDIAAQLVKGNVAESLALLTGRKVLQATKERVDLHDDLQAGRKEMAGFDQLSGVQQLKLRELLKGVNDGLYQKADIQAQINEIEDENGRKIEGLGQAHFDLLEAVEKEALAQSEVTEKMLAFNKALGLATLGFAPIIAMLISFSGTVDEIGKKFGSLVGYSDNFKDNLLESQVEVSKIGGSIEDVASITSTLASDFGVTLHEASKLSATIFDTSKAIGLSTDEAAKLIGNFMQLSNLTSDEAEYLAESTFQLARQSGVAPSVVMQDIAGSTEAIAKFTKDGGNNIAEAAVQARRMGLSLDTAAKIAEGLLDFESSVAAEVEASVLLGRELNYQKARELALSNDIAGATREIVSQLGSEEEFNNLNLIQREALAKSIGVSSAELAKMVDQTEKLTLAGALATNSFGDLLGEEGLSNLAVLTGQIKSLGVELTNTFGPILNSIIPIVTSVFGVFNDLVGALDEMGWLLPMVGAALGFLAGKLIIAAKAAFTEAYVKGVGSLIAALKHPALWIPAIIGFGGMMAAQAAKAKSFHNLGETSYAQAVSPTANVDIEGGSADPEIIMKEKSLLSIADDNVEPTLAPNFGRESAMQKSFGLTKSEFADVFDNSLLKFAGAFELKNEISHDNTQISITNKLAHGTPRNLV